MRYIHIRFAADAEAYYAFLSTPSARRATSRCTALRSCIPISIHALRPITREQVEFLSTPSARRATTGCLYQKRQRRFLSTPSARRATQRPCVKLTPAWDFYPRPPRGGRLLERSRFVPCRLISIHALREEGDTGTKPRLSCTSNFYPRPPRGGRQQTCR